MLDVQTPDVVALNPVFFQAELKGKLKQTYSFFNTPFPNWVCCCNITFFFPTSPFNLSVKIDTCEDTPQDRPTVHDPDVAFSGVREDIVSGILPDEIVIVEAEDEIYIACCHRFEMEIVGTHPVAEEANESACLTLEQAVERAALLQRGIDLAWVVDQHTVEIVYAEKFELVFEVGDCAFGGIIGSAFSIATPLRGGMATEPPGDDDILTRDLLQRQTEFPH